jgi:two-component system, OmpR family, sensor kinase
MLLLLIAAIVPADLVTSSHLRSFLIGRLDEQIDIAQSQAYTYIYDTKQRSVQNHVQLAVNDPQAWLAELSTPSDPSCLKEFQGSSPASPSASSGQGTGGDSAGRTTDTTREPRLNPTVLAALTNPDVYLEVISDSGALLYRDPSGSCARPDPAPVLPRHLPVQALPLSHVFGRSHGPYVPDRPSFETSSVVSGSHYRGQAVAVPGGTLVTAVALDPTNQTLSSLTRVEVAVSIVVALALLLVVLWLVRFGLRPLYDMTDTALAIAGGDLTRRIQRTDERSEVGRLGAALNGMLSQIEAAFRQRTSSEARLRRFIADASHELRTPLTSIRGYAELLRKGALSDPEAQRRASERIEHEAARMSVLVDDLLLLARLDQGRPFERATVDLGTVAADAVDAARTVEPSRPVSMDVAQGVLVDGDAVRLRQVFDNLLRNAQVHTPAGTVVHLGVAREGALAVIAVEDEGGGIEPEEQAHVFDRFYRGNEARTGEGTGLGLSIVEAIASAHGGSARVESEPGRGAKFVVELPALTPPDDVDGRGEGPGRDARPGARASREAGPAEQSDPRPEAERVGGRATR